MISPNEFLCLSLTATASENGSLLTEALFKSVQQQQQQSNWRQILFLPHRASTSESMGARASAFLAELSICFSGLQRGVVELTFWRVGCRAGTCIRIHEGASVCLPCGVEHQLLGCASVLLSCFLLLFVAFF